jgi:predicted nucleic acid-binding protein
VITAIDSSVVLDVLGGDREHGPSSLRALGDALEVGVVMACDIVWAEVGGLYATPDDAAAGMDGLGIRFAAIDPEVAAAAGRVWHDYRRQQAGRHRVLADFVIGTHAWMRADRFLTRDRGFYRPYFKRLKIVDPSQA